MSLKSEQILALFDRLNELLALQNTQAEIGIVGGAAMCLIYKSRAATKDVDAIFEPASLLRKLIEQVGREEGLARDWLNDAAKGFFPTNPKKEFFLNLSHLNVWSPEPAYMLAMKCISARWDTSDRDDVEFLIKYLKLRDLKIIAELIESYYPKNQIPAKTIFFLEEILAGLD